MRQIILFSLFVGWCIQNISAQDKTLNATQVLEIVKKYHPIAKQALLKVERSEADLTIAKAGFDPVFNHYSANKTFVGEKYYQYDANELKIPTWFGIEVSAGLENLSGQRFDPSETTGKTSYVGVSIPLAKNLLMDKRRAALKTAKVFNQMAYQDQKIMLNDVLFDAMQAYWKWAKTYKSYLLIQENTIVSLKRLEFTRLSFVHGERPAIDTLDAFAQYQSMLNSQEQYHLEFINSGLELSAFLWGENDVPVNLSEGVVPQAGWDDASTIQSYQFDLSKMLQTALNEHPSIMQYQYKLDALAIERKLKYQDLLPKVDLKYNQLGKGYDFTKTASTWPLFENNYQYGLKIEMPLLLFSSRGEFKKVNVKIMETQLDYSQKKLAVEIKVKSYYNELETLRKQIEVQEKLFKTYDDLIKAEETKLKQGEGALFLINQRQSKWIESYEKLIDLKAKFYKTVYALQWSAGVLN